MKVLKGKGPKVPDNLHLPGEVLGSGLVVIAKSETAGLLTLIAAENVSSCAR
jgi:hypothetical protein